MGSRPGDVAGWLQLGCMLITSQTIIELRTGAPAVTPLEWPFSNETNEEEGLDLRLSYIRGLRDLLVLALYAHFFSMASGRRRCLV